MQSRGRDQAGGNKDDDFICDEEDESMDEQSDEEEDMISTDSEVIFDWLRNLYAHLHQPIYGFCTLCYCCYCCKDVCLGSVV